MIGISFKAYVFIQTCIFFLHYIAPLSIACCVLSLFIRQTDYRIPLVLEILAIAETAFYLLVYLPRRYVLQRAAIHPTTLPPEQRRKLFAKCHSSISDPEGYLQKWFKEADPQDIKRDNVKEFFCWGFLNKGAWGPEDDEELDDYVDETEKLLGRKLEPGRGPAIALRLSLDEVPMLHRSLIWYWCVFFVDFLTYCHLYYRSFHLYRLPLSRTLSVFPFRPLALLSSHTTPAKTLTYWVHPHTSKNYRPVLFLHGIGIGLYPYVNFLSAINRNLPPDGQIGILAIEIMPISFRITRQMPERDELCAEILTILKAHNYTNFTLVSHSYGSILSTHLLHSPQISPRIHSVLLIDPVSFLLHLPDVAYNFTCRKPKRANEWQLYYFASMDMGVAHTLARRFFWSENILWKEDLGDKKCAVSLAGRDLIVNTRAVARYLTGEPKMENGAVLGKLANGMVKGKAANGNVNLKQRESSGKEIEVLWFPTKDHAQVFDHINDYGQLIKVVREFSLIEGSGESR